MREMGVSFADLIAHAAATRGLCAGTIIGSGTVANDDYQTVGSTCIAERRAIETLANGDAATVIPPIRRPGAHGGGGRKRPVTVRRHRSARGGEHQLMLDGNKIIVTVAINGGMQQDREGAIVPKQPVEIGEAAARCYEAGASVIHFPRARSRGQE